MAEKKIVSLHLIADHDFVHHTISITCSCKPEQIAKDVWKHQPSVKYRTYKLYRDGKFDVVIPDEVFNDLED
jgi:hypothetical protein